MGFTFASRIERLRGHMEVPAAAILFTGFALALFAWPGSGPAKAPAEAAPPAIPAETRPEIRRIEITAEAPPHTAPVPTLPLALAESALPPAAQDHGRSIAKGADPKHERTFAKKAVPAHRPVVARRGPETRQAAGPGPVRVEVRLAPAPSTAGILDRTLTLGSAAVEIAAGGADYAKSAASRLGRSVASLIDEGI